MYRIHADDAISGATEIAAPVEEVTECAVTETPDYYYEEDYDEPMAVAVECEDDYYYEDDYYEDDYWY